MQRALTIEDKKKYWLLGVSALGLVGLFAVAFSNLLSLESDALNFTALLVTLSAVTLLLVPAQLTRLTNWWVYVILLEFGFAPLLCKLLDVGDLDTFAVTALALIGLGTASFWTGARLMNRKPLGPAYEYVPSLKENQRTHLALIMLGIGCLSKLYMVSAGLFMYGSDLNSIDAASGYREWLTILGMFTLYAQIVLTIEFLSAPRSLMIKYAFWGATGLNIVFSLISGMKGELLVLPLSFFIIKKLTTGKIEWQLMGGMALLFLVLFPLNNSYRNEVVSQGAVTSLGTGRSALSRAFGSAGENGAGDYIATSIESIANRLNLLPNIIFLNEERTRGNTIQGDERVWMIPFYPFVPRFLWKDKPILDKGRRLSIAMGATELTSTAVTPFGDLLMTGGVIALVLGMMAIGASLQAVTNLVCGEFGPKSLFIYCILFCKFYSTENDVVLLGTSLIQATCVALLVAYFVYGGKLFAAKTATVR